MGTKRNPGAHDCYHKAEPDEPLFVLLARDKYGPTLVWLWATLRELDGERPAKVAEARVCVDTMLQWQNEHDLEVAGLGVAVLAGAMELIRACNALAKSANPGIPPGTSDDLMRVFLSMTRFEGVGDVEEVEAAPAPLEREDCAADDAGTVSHVGAPAPGQA